LLQLLRLDDDVLVGGVFIAAVDSVGFHGTVLGAVLGVGDALSTAGVQQMEVGSGGAVDGGIGLDG
jgi:hypothetical protein